MAEAASLAASLAAVAGTDDVAVGHRMRGLGLITEAAVAEGDAATALSSLAALASEDPDGAADLAVALAFPDTPLVLGRGAGQLTSALATSGKGAEAAGLALTAGPNPSAGAVRVSLSAPAAAGVEVSVYDALGRRVAVLHDGPAAEGITATFDGAAFPSGVYVVRAVVRDALGSVSILTRTVTVAC